MAYDFAAATDAAIAENLAVAPCHFDGSSRRSCIPLESSFVMDLRMA